MKLTIVQESRVRLGDYYPTAKEYTFDKLRSVLNSDSAMKKLPIGIQALAELIDPAENYVYIDKTEILCDLAHSGKYYFLSRLRRFGKSVLLSTLYELFSANKSLFKGLYAENNWGWNTSYPVIRISFGGGSYATDEQFTCQLTRIMADNQENCISHVIQRPIRQPAFMN